MDTKSRELAGEFLEGLGGKVGEAEITKSAFGDTLQEQLLNIDSAINAILVGGQSYRIGTRQLTRAELSTLKAWREELQAEVNARADSRLFEDTYVAFFDGR